jgi:Ring finger domain
MIHLVDPSSLAWAIVRLYVTTLVCLVPLSVCLLYSLLRLLQCSESSETTVLCSLAGCAFYGIVISSLWKEDMGISSIQKKTKAAPMALKVFKMSKFAASDGGDENAGSILPEGLCDVSVPCPICLERFVEENLVSYGELCQHAFHAACISQWMDLLHSSCPYCRQELQKRSEMDLFTSLVPSA